MHNSAMLGIDRDRITHMLSVSEPDASHITDCARLLSRYKTTDQVAIIHDLICCLNNWQISEKEINMKAAELWMSGYRPGSCTTDVSVGSGADSEQ